MPDATRLSLIDHIVVLMLENRSFDHMLGFLYTHQGNRSASGQPFEGPTWWPTDSSRPHDDPADGSRHTSGPVRSFTRRNLGNPR
ncbi:alkaline phosphatase family protein [Streptantibioticus ferralitis]|uniref:Alkaline phosphatase family protein n=1 Tax=Streptantibioticus ferralitis TaxID=236510 RepID=A0ABT5YYE5_9ACTN|nr:alkaline phosphatase family protein [Streptantibioticus ferralitis]MDF2256574.1 alkaline phosphatase family protein [Streptantibioticus ferralitis]